MDALLGRRVEPRWPAVSICVQLQLGVPCSTHRYTVTKTDGYRFIRGHSHAALVPVQPDQPDAVIRATPVSPVPSYFDLMWVTAKRWLPTGELSRSNAQQRLHNSG